MESLNLYELFVYISKSIGRNSTLKTKNIVLWHLEDEIYKQAGNQWEGV